MSENQSGYSKDWKDNSYYYQSDLAGIRIDQKVFRGKLPCPHSPFPRFTRSSCNACVDADHVCTCSLCIAALVNEKLPKVTAKLDALGYCSCLPLAVISTQSSSRRVGVFCAECRWSR